MELIEFAEDGVFASKDALLLRYESTSWSARGVRCGGRREERPLVGYGSEEGDGRACGVLEPEGVANSGMSELSVGVVAEPDSLLTILDGREGSEVTSLLGLSLSPLTIDSQTVRPS